MASFKMDTIQGASLEATRIGSRRTKTGLVTNITVLGSPDQMVLDKARDAVLAVVPWGTPFNNITDEKALLSKIMVYPITYNMCRVVLVYDFNEFPTTSSFLITDSGYLQGWSGNVLPGTGESIRTAWEEPEPDWAATTGGSADPDWVPARVPEDYIPSSFSLPVRTMGIVAVFFGDPPDGLTDSDGYVNNATWYGKPKGYWRIDRIETQVVGYQGYYTYTANVATRNYKDWSETGILKNKQTGRYVPVLQSEIDELISRTYSYGVMQGGTGPRAGKAGIVRTCPHPEYDLSAILGF